MLPSFCSFLFGLLHFILQESTISLNALANLFIVCQFPFVPRNFVVESYNQGLRDLFIFNSCPFIEKKELINPYSQDHK